MYKEDIRYPVFVAVLKSELLPVMGCTEPIAIAYAAAKAREVLGLVPGRAEICASNNIIKNVKSVIVPNTGGLKGIRAAAAAGFAVGDPGKGLQVISSINDLQRDAMKVLMTDCPMDIAPSDSDEIFDIVVRAYAGAHSACVRITGFHTNIVLVQRDGETLLEQQTSTAAVAETNTGMLTVEAILDFAQTVSLEDIQPVIERQIACNTAISDEGLTGRWGAAIGKTLLTAYGDDVKVRAQARAAAGSDARMSGCELAVVINSGSGNQGMTASLPVIEYARHLGSGEEMLYRALVLSNLLTIHLKTGIGRLSAYCGAVSAGCAAGAAIAYLHGGGYEEVAHTLVNSLAIVSGIICDGAKPSCAAKISSAVDAGILGWQMCLQGHEFYAGDGIVRKGVEETIKTVSRVGREGMYATDQEIIRIMTEAV